LKKNIFALLFWAAIFQVHAQSALSVIFVDVEQKPIPGVAVVLRSLPDSSLANQGFSDADGRYFARGLQPGLYSLVTSLIGHESLDTTFEVKERMNFLGTLVLRELSSLLKEATVTELQERVTQRGDTTDFNAAAFKVNPDADAGDLARKMPGIEISGGTVKAQGEEVKRVLVDGKEFFGQDPTLALRSLPAEIIDRIQVFDRMSDQSQFTGFNDGNTEKTLNIITKPGMNRGQFGKVYAGYGTDDRYQSGAIVNWFQGKRRISFIGISNNINQQNFSYQDVLQITGGGGQRGGRGGRPGFGGNNDFFVGTQNGINQTNSAGVNYSDSWGSKIQVSASFFSNRIANETESRVSRQFLLETLPAQRYFETDDRTSISTNNRFNMRFTWEPDSVNKVIFQPALSFQGNQLNNIFSGTNLMAGDKILNSTNTENDNKFTGYNSRNSLLYQRRLGKKGRTISTDLQGEFNDREGLAFLLANNLFARGDDSLFVLDQQQESQVTTQRAAVNLRYTEPLDEKTQLEVSYEPAYQVNSSVQWTNRLNAPTGMYDLLDPVLSNDFDNYVTTHSTGLALQRSTDKMQFMVSGYFQHLQLAGDERFPTENSINRTFQNFLPRAWFRYSFSKTSQFRSFYRARTNTPSVQQLQDVVDNTNPLLLSAGNPNLDQGVSHFMIARYNHTNVAKGRTFFAFLNLQLTTDYIGNTTFISDVDSTLPNGVLLSRGGQLNRPDNLGNAYTVRTFVNYGFPVKWLKSNLNLNGGGSWQQSPGLINGVENISDFYNTNAGLVLGSNISERVDFTISYNAQYNIVLNSIQQNLNNNFFTHTAGISGQWMPWKGLVFQSDFNQYLYTGLGEDFDQRFALWNAGVGYKFLKNNAAELRLTVFDLLKQNNSISRVVNETFVEDRQVNVLQRFFMLTFTYNIRGFQQPKMDENDGRPGGLPPGVTPPWRRPG
jgi:hypothetical protein